MKRFVKQIIKISPAALFVPVAAFAQGVSAAPVGLRDLSGGQGIQGVLYFIISLILGLVSLVAVLFLIIGGYQYITSAGNEESAEAGKKNIQNAIIGLIIILLSYTIVTIIYRALAGSY